MNDCDLIIYYGLNYYDEYDFIKIQELAKISTESNKRISIGYSYFIPQEKRKNDKLLYEVK